MFQQYTIKGDQSSIVEYKQLIGSKICPVLGTKQTQSWTGFIINELQNKWVELLINFSNFLFVEWVVPETQFKSWSRDFVDDHRKSYDAAVSGSLKTKMA